MSPLALPYIGHHQNDRTLLASIMPPGEDGQIALWIAEGVPVARVAEWLGISTRHAKRRIAAVRKWFADKKLVLTTIKAPPQKRIVNVRRLRHAA